MKDRLGGYETCKLLPAVKDCHVPIRKQPQFENGNEMHPIIAQ